MMRILVVSNFYPPHHLGGFEMSCKEVVEELTARGHEVRVLTSSYGLEKPTREGEVYRWLISDFGRKPKPFLRDALELFQKEIRNQRAFKRVVKELRPDLTYFWNLWTISVSMAWWAQHMSLPTCFYTGDIWLTGWREDPWYRLWPPAPRLPVRVASKALRTALRLFRILSTGVLDLAHVQFVSNYLERVTLGSGVPVAKAEVIHWGIKIEKFPYRTTCREPTRLLFVGILAPHKGVQTALEAIRILVQDHGRSDVRLTLVGGNVSPSYVSELRRFVKTFQLEGVVEFAGHVAHDNLPEIYSANDILLYPSVCDEGLGISILEAMASGLVVLGTASGGSAEILQHEVTGLVFAKEDAATCAAHVLRLISEPSLFERLRLSGRRNVEERFRVERAIDKIERSLQSQVDLVAASVR